MKEAVDHLLRFILDPGVVRAYQADDWNKLISLARFHELVALVHDLLNDNGLMHDAPEEIAGLLTGYANRQAYLTTLFEWEIGKVQRVVKQVDYPVVVLKGMAYLLAKMGSWKSRAFADIDLLVAPEHFADMEQRIQGAGWEIKALNDYDDRYYREWSHASPPLINRNSGIELDLHHHISSPISDQPIDTDVLLQDIAVIDDTGFSRLGDADLILHCANHFIYFDDLAGRFKDLVLIYFILNESNADELWRSLFLRSRQLGLQATFYYLVRLMQYYFNAEIPASVNVGIKETTIRKAVLWLLINSLTPKDIGSVRLNLVQTTLVARYQWTRYPVHIFVYHLVQKHLIQRFVRIFKPSQPAV